MYAIRSYYDDALDLAFAIGFGVPRGVARGVAAPVAEVDSAGELAHDQDIRNNFV